MKFFKTFLILQIIVIVAYTAQVGLNHGWNFFEIFLSDIQKVGWPGQFNLDFSLLLTLAALWISWRNRFSATGLLLSLLALVGGSSFFAVYLLIITIQCKNDPKKILLGGQL